MAFLQIDDLVRISLTEAQHGALCGSQSMQSRAPTRLWGREMCRQQLANRDAVLFRLKRDPLSDELPQSLLIRMLQLASAAPSEMRARRHNMMWAMFERTVSMQGVPRHAHCDVLAICCHAIAASSDADDLRSFAH